MSANRLGDEVHFNCSVINTTNADIQASYKAEMVTPLFRRIVTNSTEIAIERLKVPLKRIPLTTHNIPFEKWVVGIDGPNGLNAAFVPQFNGGSGSTGYIISGQTQTAPTVQTLNLSPNPTITSQAATVTGSDTVWQVFSTKNFFFAGYTRLSSGETDIIIAYPLLDGPNDQKVIDPNHLDGYVVWQGTITTAGVTAKACGFAVDDDTDDVYLVVFTANTPAPSILNGFKLTKQVGNTWVQSAGPSENYNTSTIPASFKECPLFFGKTFCLVPTFEYGLTNNLGPILAWDFSANTFSLCTDVSMENILQVASFSDRQNCATLQASQTVVPGTNVPAVVLEDKLNNAFDLTHLPENFVALTTTLSTNNPVYDCNRAFLFTNGTPAVGTSNAVGQLTQVCRLPVVETNTNAFEFQNNVFATVATLDTQDFPAAFYPASSPCHLASNFNNTLFVLNNGETNWDQQGVIPGSLCQMLYVPDIVNLQTIQYALTKTAQLPLGYRCSFTTDGCVIAHAELNQPVIICRDRHTFANFIDGNTYKVTLNGLYSNWTNWTTSENLPMTKTNFSSACDNWGIFGTLPNPGLFNSAIKNHGRWSLSISNVGSANSTFLQKMPMSVTAENKIVTVIWNSFGNSAYDNSIVVANVMDTSSSLFNIGSQVMNTGAADNSELKWEVVSLSTFSSRHNHVDQYFNTVICACLVKHGTTLENMTDADRGSWLAYYDGTTITGPGGPTFRNIPLLNNPRKAVPLNYISGKMRAVLVLGNSLTANPKDTTVNVYNIPDNSVYDPEVGWVSSNVTVMPVNGTWTPAGVQDVCLIENSILRGTSQAVTFLIFCTDNRGATDVTKPTNVLYLQSLVLNALETPTAGYDCQVQAVAPILFTPQQATWFETAWGNNFVSPAFANTISVEISYETQADTDGAQIPMSVVAFIYLKWAFWAGDVENRTLFQMTSIFSVATQFLNNFAPGQAWIDQTPLANVFLFYQGSCNISAMNIMKNTPVNGNDVAETWPFAACHEDIATNCSFVPSAYDVTGFFGKQINNAGVVLNGFDNTVNPGDFSFTNIAGLDLALENQFYGSIGITSTPYDDNYVHAFSATVNTNGLDNTMVLNNIGMSGSQPKFVGVCPSTNLNATQWMQQLQVGTLSYSGATTTFSASAASPVLIETPQSLVATLFSNTKIPGASDVFFSIKNSSSVWQYTSSGVVTEFLDTQTLDEAFTRITGFVNTPSIIDPAGDYTIWSISQYLLQINKALLVCFNKAGFPAGTMPPVFTYNYTTKSISLNVDTLLANDPSVHIYINDVLQTILRLPIASSDTTPLTLAMTAYPAFDVSLASIINPPSSATGNARYFAIQQEGQSLQQLWDLTLIVIRSVSIPVTGDIEATNQLNAITDVSLDVGNFDINGDLIYLPYFLRLYTLEQNQQLRQFNIEIWWEDREGVRHPLYLAPGDQASFKLVFLRH